VKARYLAVPLAVIMERKTIAKNAFSLTYVPRGGEFIIEEDRYREDSAELCE
jgi:hypothetical protein